MRGWKYFWLRTISCFISSRVFVYGSSGVGSFSPIGLPIFSMNARVKPSASVTCSTRLYRSICMPTLRSLTP